MFMRTFRAISLAVLTALMLLACSALEEPVSSLDDGISKMQTLPVGSVSRSERVLSNTEPEYLSTAAGIDSSLGTNFKIVEINEARVFDEGYTLGFNSSAIWLGSILDASSLPESKFDELVFDRAPYTFSISIKGNGQEVRGTVNGTRSDYEQKLSDLLSQSIVKPQPGSAEFSMDKIYSKEDLLFKVGFGVGLDKDGISAKLSGLFDFSSSKVKTRILVKFIQVYYSATIDKPSRPSDLFSAGLQFSEFQNKVSGSVSPVYISSIKYGRMGYLSIESEETEDVVNAALNEVVASSNYNANINLSAAQSNVFKSSTIRVVMVGGGLDSMSNITGKLESFLQWIQDASGEHDITSGMPIAFELSYLKNNRTAEIYKMNKQYAVIWNNNSKVGFKVQNRFVSYKLIGGNLFIRYVNKDNYIIKKNEYSFRNNFKINVDNNIDIASDVIDTTAKIVIGFEGVYDNSPSMIWPGYVNRDITINVSDLIQNENLYKDWNNYGGFTTLGQGQFMITPIK